MRRRRRPRWSATRPNLSNTVLDMPHPRESPVDTAPVTSGDEVCRVCGLDLPAAAPWRSPQNVCSLVMNQRRRSVSKPPFHARPRPSIWPSFWRGPVRQHTCRQVLTLGSGKPSWLVPQPCCKNCDQRREPSLHSGDHHPSCAAVCSAAHMSNHGFKHRLTVVSGRARGRKAAARAPRPAVRYVQPPRRRATANGVSLPPVSVLSPQPFVPHSAVVQISQVGGQTACRSRARRRDAPSAFGPPGLHSNQAESSVTRSRPRIFGLRLLNATTAPSEIKSNSVSIRSWEAGSPNAPCPMAWPAFA